MAPRSLHARGAVALGDPFRVTNQELSDFLSASQRRRDLESRTGGRGSASYRDRSLCRMAACSASLNFRWRWLRASNSFLLRAARMSPLGR